MIRYDILATLPLSLEGAFLRSQILPELVHMDDPARSVMTDFSMFAPHTIFGEANMDDALNEMKLHDVHLLLVMDIEHRLTGVIGSGDLLGERPIKIIQERRIPRDQVLVKMIMAPLNRIVAFNIDDVEHSRVGNIVMTLKHLRQHYALVIQKNEDEITQTIRGIFTTSQISRQLHQDIANSIAKAPSVSELQRIQRKEEK